MNDIYPMHHVRSNCLTDPDEVLSLEGVGE
jgi:hypothetical protein